MKRNPLIQAVLLLIATVFLASNIAFAYIPDVGNPVCIFKQSNGAPCDDATQYCMEGCPLKNGGDDDGGDENNGPYSEADAPGPVFFGFMFVAVIIIVAIFAGRKKQLTNVQLPPNQPPLAANPPATQPTAAVGKTEPSSTKDKPKTEDKESKKPAKGPRKFRPSYSKRIAKKPVSRKMGKM
jgi:hypothetical protein